MHPDATIAAALELRKIGMSTAWIARELGVPYRTVDRWLRGGPPRGRREPPRPIPPEPYAYLLGLYLGDGHISRGPRQHYLTIACDAGYPGIVASATHAIEALVPGHSVHHVRHPIARCTRVVCCSRLWPVLFPQHGHDRKHTRRILLARWQREITAAHPEALVRGLIHSDGCRFVANQRCGARVYSYVRYAFTNRSDDIKRILCDHLDLLGIGWTQPNAWLIAIDRRSEVAKLDAFVGPKR